MTHIVCKMYNTNRWYSFWWRVPVIDDLFYRLHNTLCPDNEA
jgi:hypothetical protein